jgi:glucosyl-dolichyl phosphate glucuronosyltransferase
VTDRVLEQDTVSLDAVICTRNRSSYLRKTLAALISQARGCSNLRITVVDNMSDDDTADVVRTAAAQFPDRVRLLTCDRMGENCARNIALHASTADLIAYVDDDAVPEPAWSASVLHRFATSGADVVALAGAIDPAWEGEVPYWLTPDVAAYYSVLDLGPTARPLTSHESFVAANVAFRRAALISAGGFHERLGRVGKSLFSNGEVFTCRVLQRAGFTILYEPTMRVRHSVAASRLNWQWLAKRIYQQGRSDVVMWALLDPPQSRITHAQDCIAYLLRWIWNCRRIVFAKCSEARRRASCSSYLLAGRTVGSAQLLCSMTSRTLQPPISP